ncbi:hypothetical protein BE20_34945 [Sorangium cellulosum]|nr:hypothetical protein BE20_34945 [Sorangium cellulosum]
MGAAMPPILAASAGERSSDLVRDFDASFMTALARRSPGWAAISSGSRPLARTARARSRPRARASGARSEGFLARFCITTCAIGAGT